ncbi:hypothetical protein DH2020_018464 [Rehmannia glutinosa]|uniref:Pectinesterase n=1 Tax=Rehmannia glutinosa TaxID=99300 RepID=A0ABR0WMK8_REHGL
MSRKRLNQALEALHKSPENHKMDIQTWLSAALTFQQTCKDSVENQAPSNVYAAEIYKKMDYLSQLGSNTLALANRISTGNPKENKSLTDRRVFELESFVPSWVSGPDRKLLLSTEITNADAVVAKDGSGNFKTVSEAIQAATGSRFNTAGPQGQQAVALAVASDQSVFYRCSIAGYQDTLYALSFRQFYRECDIYGTIDFIFGNAAAVFQSCNLVLRRPGSHGAYNVILASGRTDPGQNTGFSVQNCRITVGSDFGPVKSSYESYLGRPWKQYSRAVVMQSKIDGAISPRGWVEWPGPELLCIERCILQSMRIWALEAGFLEG